MPIPKLADLVTTPQWVEAFTRLRGGVTIHAVATSLGVSDACLHARYKANRSAVTRYGPEPYLSFASEATIVKWVQKQEAA